MSEKYDEKYYRGKRGLDCFLKLKAASSHIHLFTIENTNLARQMIREALVKCPENPECYVHLGWVYQNDYLLGNTKSSEETIEKGIDLAQKALLMDDSMNDSVVDAHSLLCSLYLSKREYDKAIVAGERAFALNPGRWAVIYHYAECLTFAGRPKEAIPLLERVIRLNPRGSAFIYTNFGRALRMTGRLEESVLANKKAIQLDPNNSVIRLELVVAYSMLDRTQEARTEAGEFLRINPKFTLDSFVKMFPYKDPSALEKYYYIPLRKAGLT